ncbi:MAG: peptidylprolyl isomerase [Deltaproteobacteria bacterium]|nr:peptidylprolyl isomerase [Deltaproteobacteria bacterium]
MATATIKTKFGDIGIEFLPAAAPKHVENFLKLARDKFYDGTTFHRVIPGFMIQGGCPNTKAGAKGQPGTGGPGWNVKAEFNKTSHARGVVSMARSSDPNSAGSQFFICVADSNFLDGQYTAFGRVVSGMEVADKIVAVSRDKGDMPYDRVEMTVTVAEG